MLKEIRLKIGTFFLKKQLKSFKRERSVFNLDNGQSFGILYEAIDQESFETINNFVDVLKRAGKFVQVLGYVPAKRFEQDYFLKLDFHLYKYSDVNWSYTPSKQCVTDFIQRDYDVLIDLSLSDQFPLRYVAALSKAKFKIGKDSIINQNIYDMLITITGANFNLKEFIRTVRHYMSMINNSQEITEQV